MVERKRGDRSRILLNEVDVIILKIINKSKKEVSNRVLSATLNINHLSLRGHLNRLLGFEFISRKKALGENRYVITITKDGLKVLKSFEKFI